MSISKKEAQKWAEFIIQETVAYPNYSDVYDNEHFTEEYPNEDDWDKVFRMVEKAKVLVSWDD